MLKDVKENKLIINEQVGISAEKQNHIKRPNRKFQNGKKCLNERFSRWALVANC